GALFRSASCRSPIRRPAQASRPCESKRTRLRRRSPPNGPRQRRRSDPPPSATAEPPFLLPHGYTRLLLARAAAGGNRFSRGASRLGPAPAGLWSRVGRGFIRW